MAFSSESSDDTSSNASNLDSDSSDSSHTRAVKAERRAHTKANTKDYRIDRITAHHRSVWKRVSDYADQVFEAWGIGGYQGQDNGMFLFVWRHEPNWHYAIKLGSAWADNTNHFQLMDNVIEKIIKLDIPTAYNTQNSLADALQVGRVWATGVRVCCCCCSFVRFYSVLVLAISMSPLIPAPIGWSVGAWQAGRACSGGGAGRHRVRDRAADAGRGGRQGVAGAASQLCGWTCPPPRPSAHLPAAPHPGVVLSVHKRPWLCDEGMSCFFFSTILFCCRCCCWPS